MAKRINNVTIKEVTLQASDEKKTCEMVIFRADPNVLDPSALLDFVIDEYVGHRQYNVFVDPSPENVWERIVIFDLNELSF